jgi:hypothetical protein
MSITVVNTSPVELITGLPVNEIIFAQVWDIENRGLLSLMKYVYRQYTASLPQQLYMTINVRLYDTKYI